VSSRPALGRGAVLCLIFALSGWVLAGCSADSAAEPEPTLDTKGAFVAVVGDAGELELYRTLAILGEGNDNDAFFVVPYIESPASFAAAREMAKDPDLPHRAVTVIGRRYVTSREWRVVWFRSVSYEEQESFR
jgi:hypothetical protein